jgi:hypothetical protein
MVGARHFTKPHCTSASYFILLRSHDLLNISEQIFLTKEVQNQHNRIKK